MKAFFIIIFCACLQLAVKAQILSDTLKISDTRTTHLICPDKVDYVQAGDYSIVQAEVVPELSNLVRIKATRPFENSSSLTVVCKNRIYSFELIFGNNVPITYPVEMFHSRDAMTFSGKLMPDYQLKDLCDRVLDKHQRRGCYRKRKNEKDGIRIRLNSIFLKNDALFFELEMQNKTQMAYDMESVNFWITDKKKTKATNVQEYQVLPDYRRSQLTRIPGETSVREVFVFEKMTIPDRRILRIELNEKALGNTGRKLSFNLKNKDILKARKL
ncbi:MAG: conjugative transposon protein TraN [Mangrovibacterium sp.]